MFDRRHLFSSRVEYYGGIFAVFASGGCIGFRSILVCSFIFGLFLPLLDKLISSLAVIRVDFVKRSENLEIDIFESVVKLRRLYLDSLLNGLAIVVYLADQVFSLFLNVALLTIWVDERDVIFDMI